MPATKERHSHSRGLVLPRQRNEMKWNEIKGIHRHQKATHGNWRARRLTIPHRTIPFYTKPYQLEEAVISASSSGPHRWWWCLQLSYNARPSCSSSHSPFELTSLCGTACVHVCTLPPFHSPTPPHPTPPSRFPLMPSFPATMRGRGFCVKRQSCLLVVPIEIRKWICPTRDSAVMVTAAVAGFLGQSGS